MLRLHQASFLATALLSAARLAAAQDLTGTWAGGTNATGRWYYAEAHFSGPRATLDVPGAQVAGLALEAFRLDGDRVSFRIPTPLGTMTFAGTLRDGVIEGAVSGGAPGTMLHLMRTATPPQDQASAAVGRYTLDNGEEMLVVYRPFGQLGVTILERSGTAEKLKRTLIAIPVGPNAYVTSGSIVPALKADETLALQRDPGGAVTAIAWGIPQGRPRTAQRMPGLRQRPVRFDGPAGPITGTLYLPDGAGPFPAVALVGGSGPTTRDNLLIRARAFAGIGVAALSWDKRGNGETAGEYSRATFDDLAADAASAVTFLKSAADIDPARVGVEGHSQGGWIVPLAVQRAGGMPGWVVISSGGPTPPLEQEAWRARTQTRAGGGSEADATAAEAFMRRKWAYAFTGVDWAGYEGDARQASAAKWAGVVSPILSPDSLGWTFMRSLKRFDPMTSAAALRVPTLVIFGDADEEEPFQTSRANWLEAFRRSGNADHDIVIIPGGGHALWIGPGDPRPVVTAPTEAIRKWLLAHRVIR